MALRVLIGPANAGKTGVLHERLRSCIASGGTAALLLPSAPDVSRALAELAHTMPVGLTVSTFAAFLDRLWNESNPATPAIGSTRRLLVLADIVNSTPLDALGPSARGPGFVNALASLAERAERSPHTGRGARLDSSVEGEILGLLDAYGRRIADDGLIERAEAHRRAAESPHLATLPEVIAINRFTGFTAAQEAFIIGLARSREVLVALTYDQGVPATFAAAAQVERLADAGETTTVRAVHAHSGSPELVRIERSLGRCDAEDAVAEGAVVLSEAWGPAAEAARIVREVQDAVASGCAPGSVAIAFRDPTRHVRALRTAFDEAGMDADWDLLIPFGFTRLGRALLLLLGFHSGTCDASGVMDVLRSPYCSSSGDALDDLDVRLRASRGMGGAAFERACSALDADTGALLADVRRAIRLLGTAESERAWWRVLRRMMGHARPGAPILDLDGLMDAAAQRTFMQAVAESATVGAARVSPSDLGTALRAASVTIVSADRADRVQVMSTERLRGRRFRCVVLGGLTTGEFPRHAHEDAFSSPALRAGLARAGVDLPPRSTLDDERLMFYQAVTRASERLVLSWQSHDADGRPTRPSVFLEELLDLYRDPSTGVWTRGEPPHHVLALDDTGAQAAAPHSRRRMLRAAASSGSHGASEVENARLGHARYRSRSRPACLGAEARNALASRETFSVTDIETYIQCPFRWYVERVLRPGEIDVEVDAATSGRLAHEIMAASYERFMARTGAERVEPASLGLALEAHADAAEAAVARIRTAGAAEEMVVRAAVRNTRRVLTDDATLLPGFAPRYREWSFGLARGDEPESFGDFALVGRIDRIDTDARRLIVTDYKSGRLTSRRACAKFEDEGLVQLPLYATVAAGRLGLEVAGGLYRGIGGGSPRGFVRDDVHAGACAIVSTDVISAESIAALVERAVERAREAVVGMRAGEIPARPIGRSCPSYCAARVLCARRGDARV